MLSKLLGYASALAILATASAQTYPANTNTNCVTASDVDYQAIYYYNSTDVMDWGVITQSQGTCDSGSYARVHVIDPSGNDIDCGYVALDGAMHTVSCSNYPRGYMQEGQYTIYWETVPGVSQYSWNQFSVIHIQSTITAAVPTQSVTTTPLTVLTTTFTTTPTETKLIQQVTVTSPSATKVNTIVVTPPATTITTTSTSWYTLTSKVNTQTTITAIATAACRKSSITPDKTGNRGSSNNSTTSKKSTTTTTQPWWYYIFGRSRFVRRDGDVPNTVGIIGPVVTTTVTPDAVITTITAATSTSTVTSTLIAPGVTITGANPTPTLTVYSGVAVSTITTTLPQVTKSVVRNKLGVTVITTTSTLTITKKTTTTPLCVATGK